MKLDLWLIPALPLLGFLLNGVVALFSAWGRAKKETAAWRAAHPDHGHDPHGGAHAAAAPVSEHDETAPGVHLGAPGHDADAHDDHGAGHAHGGGSRLPHGQRLFHGLVGVLSVGLAALVAFVNLVPYALQVLKGGEAAPVVQKAYTWIAAGSFSVDIAFRLDPLSAFMLSFVTFVGTLIHLYSVGYMQEEEGYGRFFAYLNLFMFAMLMLVLADNLPMLFIGWEGVGLCSYLLIGYYYGTDFAPAAGKKAFVANRVGDFGMILGIFAILALFGTTDFSFVHMARQHVLNGAAPVSVFVACLLLFLGACGKSAQVPLYVWLPDAMAGPTPVSALIHAATMVTAGVYLVARCSAVFLLAPDALDLVAFVGALTAVFAASIGLAQNDVKKVLAYSTVSQLGYMFLACGVGAFAAGMFHVFTHAFFKACLFLGSGSVIHAMSGEQDMRNMGGLGRKVPWTYGTFLVATAALSGVPLFAGFFSKDAILASVFGSGNRVLWGVGVFTAGLTAFYMTRLVRMTFHGEFRGTKEQEAHVHESPPTMVVPLVVLAAFSVIAGFFGIPAILGGNDTVVRFLSGSVGEPHEHHMSHALEWMLMGTSVAAAAIGIFWAARWYAGNPVAADAPAAGFLARTGALGKAVANKWNVDEGIEVAVLNPFRRIGSFLWRGADALFIDGIVNASAFLVELTGDLLRFFTTGNVRNYALGVSLGVVVLLLYVWVR